MRKCDFDRGIIVGARWCGLISSEAVDLLGFSCTTVSRVYREWCIKWAAVQGAKTACSWERSAEKVQAGSGWRECYNNSNNHVLQQWYAEDHLWTHNVSNLEVDVLQQEKTNTAKKNKCNNWVIYSVFLNEVHAIISAPATPSSGCIQTRRNKDNHVSHISASCNGTLISCAEAMMEGVLQ